jgi:hypothetical protein
MTLHGHCLGMVALEALRAAWSAPATRTLHSHCLGMVEVEELRAAWSAPATRTLHGHCHGMVDVDASRAAGLNPRLGHCTVIASAWSRSRSSAPPGMRPRL